MQNMTTKSSFRNRLLFLIITIVLIFSIVPSLSGKEYKIWQIGEKDERPLGFAMAPNGFKDFIQNDFGYEDKFYLVNHSLPVKDFPYVLPGPSDTWGGTWPTSGWRTHEINILFGLDEADAVSSNSTLVIDLVDFSKQFLPLLKVSVNSVDKKFQLSSPGYSIDNQKKSGQMEPLTDTLSLVGNYSKATPISLRMELDRNTLKKGGNQIKITILEGSWIIFDHIGLISESPLKASSVDDVFLRSVYPADYEIEEDGGMFQPLIVDLEHVKGLPEIEVSLDGKNIFRKKIEEGRYQLEVPMPAVKKSKNSKIMIYCDGEEIFSEKIFRSHQKHQTLADYVDTRIGTAHSRWMIAPGPWMPYSMVKFSPDNQNEGWQAGYQPSFENIGCFSHIHEWTMGGLGIMAANGELKTKVGDEQKPDEGYRSRIDKRTEKAGIGSYSVFLQDYGIKAEITATTRCGYGRFTFPRDSSDGRILIELHPQTENRIDLHEIKILKVGGKRLEGYVHQVSPQVWSNDAEQDYILNFVIDFDKPLKSLGTWLDGKITDNADSLVCSSCKEAGLFATFDTKSTPVVQFRTGISLVSVNNARENLEKEIIQPFGWDYEAVVLNQKKVWNEIFGRLEIKTDDRLEKVRFYNQMYRSICSRNTWSDCNGEWVATDGKVRKVADPKNDVMLGSDAFWNTFWNLNQFWNLVTPEISSKWVHSQLAMYDANGWLAKGPAGLNYIPVMVAEHEIPMIVGAYQMGIRDFDASKALEAAVKMQTTPAQKVFKGYAGNRDLKAYLEYGYVPYDKGRFSNTMEYSFDDWTVGQLAKALGKESEYETFNDRGNWWKNVISEDGYCQMKDSKGKWVENFDPFRSGANQHYVEGNAWQLTFFVPQDIPSLVNMIGKERFVKRLLWGFSQDEPFRYNAPNDQYWDHPIVQGNQQSMHFAYLFNYAGAPWYTQKWARSILSRYYGCGYANAYLGDEDQGQMSAWAVMTSIGLFQMDGGCKVDPEYEIASPIFQEVKIHLGHRYGRGGTFIIKARNASKKNIYVQKATLNGVELNSFKFPASELLGGGELLLEMGPEPNRNWGVAAD